MNASTDPASISVKRSLLLDNLGLLGLCLLLTGCPAQKTPSIVAVSPDKIVIKGSNTIGEELAPKLIGEYQKLHPQITLALETKGSAGGIWGLIAGVCDIAAASRPLVKDEQQQAELHGVQLKDNIIGSYSVAVALNSANPVANLTRQQVRDIFTGVVHNWSEVGGPDAEIKRYIRNPVSGTYLGFRELAMEDKPYTTNQVVEFTSYAEITQAVAADPHAIGYCSIQASSQPGVKAVSIDGVAPTIAAVQQAKYPYARVLHLYTDKTRESTQVSDFVRFVLSANGQEIVTRMGFVPHP